MLTRTAFALLLLFPAATSAQDLDTAVSALVRISGMRGGTPVRGSGFVVGLDHDKATIVTASHVIEGVQQLEVTFAADPTESFSAGVVLGMESGNPRGLAVFQARGTLPAGLTSLSFEVESRPILGAALFLLGFPEMALAPRATQRVLSARNGMLLLIDQSIGEGFSGGPVLQGGKVVGVITDTDAQTTYAVSSVVARESLAGWVPCVSGEERTENGIVFVRICPGSFMMGSAEHDPQAATNEKPTHQVTLSEFWIGRTEVTNEQYRGFRPDHQGEDRLPVITVSWFDATAACEHFGGGLPTEAQWEYAARAGSRTSWSFGDKEELLAEYAWYEKSSANAPHPVGIKKANAWGLQDMHGNVWEWVADWYADTYHGRALPNPTGPTAGKLRVLRGGAFGYTPGGMLPAIRYGFMPEYRDRFIGFRCVRGPHRQP